MFYSRWYYTVVTVYYKVKCEECRHCSSPPSNTAANSFASPLIIAFQFGPLRTTCHRPTFLQRVPGSSLDPTWIDQHSLVRSLLQREFHTELWRSLWGEGGKERGSWRCTHSNENSTRDTVSVVECHLQEDSTSKFYAWNFLSTASSRGSLEFVPLKEWYSHGLHTLYNCRFHCIRQAWGSPPWGKTPLDLPPAFFLHSREVSRTCRFLRQLLIQGVGSEFRKILAARIEREKEEFFNGQAMAVLF